MSMDPALVETIAIAFVVESSLAIAAEWHRIMGEYVSQMLIRLTDTNPGYKLRMGFVTYATADTLPSPLLCKRFFTDHQPVTKEMKDDPAKLGIGRTNSGGSRGMSALEGLIAAVELFDILRSNSQLRDQGRPHICHIFHIAASPPDTTKYPQWNDSPVLDSVTWEGLPSELKKRNINLSSINLRSQFSQFSELHSAAAPGVPVNPWFSLRGTDSVLLAGFSVSSQQKPVKRAGDTNSLERTPETKRQRTTQPVEASPRNANMPITQVKPPLTPQAQPQNAPAAVQHAPRVPPAEVISRFPPKVLMDRLRTAEEQLRSLENDIKNARITGNSQLAEALSQEWKKKNDSQMKFKKAIAAYAHSQHMIAAKQQAQARAHSQQLQEGASNALSVAGPSSVPPVHSSPIKDAAHLPGGSSTDDSRGVSFVPQTTSSDPQVQVPAHPHSRNISGSGFPPPPNSNPTTQQLNAASQQLSMQGGNPRVQMSPSITAQMQKPVEQQQRTLQRLGVGAMGQVTHPNPNAQYPEMASGSGPSVPIQLPPPTQPQLAEQPNAIGGKSAVWNGTLSWSGLGAQGKKEVRTFVVASTPNPSECHASTWPTTLALIPTRESAVSYSDLQLWMGRHKPILCTFRAQPQVSEMNDHNYRSLVTLLTGKNIYAVSGWTRPSGSQGNNVLIFPINNVGLVGAFFPLTGIPEIPKPLVSLPTLAGVNLPPSIAAQLSRLTPEQRNAVMASLLRQRQQQTQLASQGGAVANMSPMALTPQYSQMQQPQQDSSGGNPGFGTNTRPTGSHDNTGGMLGLAAGQGVNNHMYLGQPGAMGAGLPRPAAGGMQGVPVSTEMMQSFMHRNAEGGSGMGPT